MPHDAAGLHPGARLTIRHLDRLLNPSSVAVYGASTRPSSVGATIWRNLRAGGFAGALYPVNPKHAALDGVKAYARAPPTCRRCPTSPSSARRRTRWRR
jgi:acetyltransferase